MREIHRQHVFNFLDPSSWLQNSTHDARREAGRHVRGGLRTLKVELEKNSRNPRDLVRKLA
jgi:hypothetical protein